VEEAPINVLVADDHPIVREHVGRAINGDVRLALAGEAGDGIEALRMLEELRPDAVVLDLAMPRLDGAGVLRERRERRLSVRVLMLPGHAVDLQIYEARHHEPDSLLSMDVSAERICDEIVAMHGTTEAAPGRFIPKPAHRIADRTFDLSEREWKVLRLSHEGRTRKQIGKELSFTTSTVRDVRHDICTKLGTSSIHMAIVVALQIGLLE
jgi:DNA-binding NarL/FixJ family response regulator